MSKTASSKGGREKPPASKAARWGLLAAVCLVILAAAVWLTRRAGTDRLELDGDVFVVGGADAVTGPSPNYKAPPADSSSVTTDAKLGASEKPETVIGFIKEELARGGDYGSLKIDYPEEGSIFPPDMVAPTFLWHDSDCETNAWLVDIRFDTVPHHIYALVSGARTRRGIDTRCVTGSNTWDEPAYQASAKAWTPDERTWGLVKRTSVETEAVVTIFGLRGTHDAAATRTVTTRGSVKITTSKDPVGAQIFYRDVPLMPSETKDGLIKPLADFALPLIEWRLRDLSKRTAPVVMQHLPTCSNCHTFSYDGKTLAMDMDGPSGDKGAHAVLTVKEHMVVKTRDVFTWNSFEQEGIEKKYSFGMFPQVSPDGRYVVATVHESVYVQNYMDYKFLQTFYPTRGILAIYNRSTGEIRSLPGADDVEYVQSNASWSPDGKELIFIRAKARDNYGDGPRSTHANDPNETQIQYDLYRIPFNEGTGGVAEPIPGASNNGMSNSFPRMSPDGRWIVWVQCKTGLLQRPDGKLYIMPAQGGTPRLMNCNSEPMNSWHSWSPNSRWLVFTSKRNTPYTQMFLTHVDEEGNDSPAILIPNSTAFNRAVNLPEFANIPAGGLAEIAVPAAEYRRHFDKANALIKKKARLEEVLAELNTSLALKGDYPETHVTLGNVLNACGRSAEAIEHYQNALEIDPHSFPAHSNLAACLGNLGRYEEAIEHYNKALEVQPRIALMHNMLGMALSRVGRFTQAIEHFRKAVEFDPRYDDAHCNLGDALGRCARPAEAVEHFRQAVEINPKSHLAHYGWAKALIRLGRTQEAVGHFRKVIELDSSHAPSHYRLARILATHPNDALRNGAEAVRLAKVASAAEKDRNPLFLDTLAAAYAEAGRFDDAVRTAEKARNIARLSGKAALADEITAHLALFKDKRPLRSEN